VDEAASDTEIGGVIHYRLDAQGAALFQILLDPRVLIERVHGHFGAAGDNLVFLRIW
jgi:hypothetical protein